MNQISKLMSYKKNTNNSKLKIVFSPYTYARITVMDSQLLKKEDYDKLLKMGYNEAIHYIEHREYKQELSKYNFGTANPNIIETALNENLIQSLKKMHRISNESTKKLIEQYTQKYENHNIKTLLRIIITGKKIEQPEELIYETLKHNKEYYLDLLNKKPREIIKQIEKERGEQIIPTETLQKLEQEEQIQKKAMKETEDILDKYELETLGKLSEKLKGKDSVSIKEMLHELTELHNHNKILRNATKGVKTKKETLINPNTDTQKILRQKTTQNQIKKILQLNNITDKNEELDYFEIEQKLKSNTIKTTTLTKHKNPLSITYILNFLFKKETEIQNLKILLKGKIFGFDENQIRKMMVIYKWQHKTKN